MEVLKADCAAAGTLPLTHASYFARKSSHSGTPTFSPLVLVVEVFAAVFDDALLALPALAVFAVLAVLSAPPHASRARPAAMQRARRKGVLLVIGNFFSP